MSFGVHRKLLKCLGISAFLWLAMPTSLWAQQTCAPCASFGTPCAVGCQSHHCPPAFKYCVEGPPHIHWSHGCPHPICNPCDLPHWGFYETCWNPWPFPPNWTHCPTPPPAAMVVLNPYLDPHTLPSTAPPRSGFGPPQSGVPSPMPMAPSGIDELNTPRRYDGPPQR
jgi:hypothetical protein